MTTVLVLKDCDKPYHQEPKAREFYHCAPWLPKEDRGNTENPMLALRPSMQKRHIHTHISVGKANPMVMSKFRGRGVKQSYDVFGREKSRNIYTSVLRIASTAYENACSWLNCFCQKGIVNSSHLVPMNVNLFGDWSCAAINQAIRGWKK